MKREVGRSGGRGTTCDDDWVGDRLCWVIVCVGGSSGLGDSLGWGIVVGAVAG